MSASARRAWLLPCGVVALLTGCGARTPAIPPDLALLTPAGRPFVGDVPTDASALLLVARRRGTDEVRVLGDAGRGALLAGLPRRDEQVEVWAAGCLPEPVTWPVRAPIRLREGIRVRLRVTAPGGLPSAPFHVGLDATWYGPGDLPEAPVLAGAASGAPIGWLDAARRPASVDPTLRVDAERPEVAATFSRPGTHRLRVTVWEATSGAATYGLGPSDPGVLIEVRPEREGPPQVIEVALDAGFLREATERGER